MFTDCGRVPTVCWPRARPQRGSQHGGAIAIAALRRAMKVQLRGFGSWEQDLPPPESQGGSPGGEGLGRWVSVPTRGSSLCKGGQGKRHLRSLFIVVEVSRICQGWSCPGCRSFLSLIIILPQLPSLAGLAQFRGNSIPARLGQRMPCEHVSFASTCRLPSNPLGPMSSLIYCLPLLPLLQS